MEEITKQISVFGTYSLENCSSILVYNSNTFLNPIIVENLGLTKSELFLLREETTLDNIVNKYHTLVDHKEFLPIPKKNNIYRFNNRLNIISGQGFNEIIFLDNNNNVVGFGKLLKVIGYNESSYQESSDLFRNYLVDFINITITCDNIIKIDESNIKILDNIKVTNRELDCYKLSDKLDLNLHSNYNKSILDIRSGSRAIDITTNTNFCKKINDKFLISKLNILRDLNLPEEYKDFPYVQVGYFKGDISIYIWNDEGEYSIYSLTDKIMFDTTTYMLKPHTTPNSLFGTCIYKLPKLNEEELSIDYFSGKYIICKAQNDSRYLFDIDLQTSKLNSGWVVEKYNKTGIFSNYKLSSQNNWILVDRTEIPTFSVYNSLVLVPDNIKEVSIEQTYPVYLRNFIIDQTDPECKIIKYNSSQSYREIILNFPEISNLFINSENIISKGGIPLKKFGSWIVFKTIDGLFKIYSNSTKVVKLSTTDNDPIIINDQTLLLRTDNEYTLYDSDGYFITESANSISKLNNISLTLDEIYGNNYVMLKPKSFILDPTNLSSSLQKSFFKYFRRNYLPDDLKNLIIFGGLRGMIFYRKNKTIINFL